MIASGAQRRRRAPIGTAHTDLPRIGIQPSSFHREQIAKRVLQKQRGGEQLPQRGARRQVVAPNKGGIRS
jgi:hypothetical protein